MKGSSASQPVEGKLNFEVSQQLALATTPGEQTGKFSSNWKKPLDVNPEFRLHSGSPNFPPAKRCFAAHQTKTNAMTMFESKRLFMQP